MTGVVRPSVATVAAAAEPARDLRSTDRFIAGDPLRAIAALTVLVYHAALVSDPGLGDARFAQQYGHVAGTLLKDAALGVFLFFVLSGYLISRPFVRAYVSNGPMPSLSRYLRNRALRIVPAFWCVVTVTLVVAGLAGRPLLDVLSVYGFAQAVHETATSGLIVQGWTLGVEVSFYLAVPLAAAVVVGASRRLRSTVARRAVVIAAALAFGIASAKVPDSGPFHRTIVTLFYAFVPGVVLAALEPPRAAPLGGRARTAVSVTAVALVAAGVAIILHPFWRVPGILGIGAGAIVAGPLLLQRLGGRSWRAARSPVLHWLGERSYSIYLIHWGVLLLLRQWLQRNGHPVASFLTLLAVAVPATLLLAALSFALVERPFLRLRGGRHGQEFYARVVDLRSRAPVGTAEQGARISSCRHQSSSPGTEDL